MYALLAAAEPPTIVLMLIGTACLLFYACVRRVRTPRSPAVGRIEKSRQKTDERRDRRAA